jgi:hypothetical protein
MFALWCATFVGPICDAHVAGDSSDACPATRREFGINECLSSRLVCHLCRHICDAHVAGMSSDECPVTRRTHGNREEVRLELIDELLSAVRACVSTVKVGGAMTPVAELSFLSL